MKPTLLDGFDKNLICSEEARLPSDLVSYAPEPVRESRCYLLVAPPSYWAVVHPAHRFTSSRLLSLYLVSGLPVGSSLPLLCPKVSSSLFVIQPLVVSAFRGSLAWVVSCIPLAASQIFVLAFPFLVSFCVLLILK